MRIAFDAKRAYHNTRGLGNYSRDVIRLLTSYATDNEYFLLAKPTNKYVFPNTKTISPQSLWSFFPSIWRSCGCVKELRDMDVYWGLSGELPFGIHRLPIRKIVTIHDAIFIRYPELYSASYRALFARKVQYACDCADVIIAISEQTKRDVIKFFHADESKIRVVYQGCNNCYREPILDSQINSVRLRYNLREQYILTVGAIEPRKNLQNLIKAMAIEHIDIPLIAVGGKSAYATQMATLAKENGVDLRFIHGIPLADLPAVYKGATVFCYPSIFEGFGIPILESMCVGTPVLTSTGSCFAETGGDAARYANPLVPEDIGTQLRHILDDTTEREKMISQGFEQATHFRDDQVAANLVRVVLSEQV